MGFSLNPVKHLKKKARKLKKGVKAPFSAKGRKRLFRKAVRTGLTATGIGAAAVIAYDVKRTRDRSQNAKDAANRRTAQINAEIRRVRERLSGLPPLESRVSPGHTHLNPIDDAIMRKRRMPVNGGFNPVAGICQVGAGGPCNVDRSRTKATRDNLGHIIKPRVGAAIADEEAPARAALAEKKPLLAGVGGLAVVIIGTIAVAAFAQRG